MKVNFIINDYMLIWTLLFQGPVKESISKLRKKLWKNYQEEFAKIYKDKNEVLIDSKNYIPNNDIVYNLIKENEDYEDLKKEIEKYRCKIMRLWDSNIRKTKKILEDIIRMDLGEHNIIVVHENQNMLDASINNNEIKTIVLGKSIDEKNPFSLIYEIIYNILEKEINKTSIQNEDIRKAILELAIYNEFPTRLINKSQYITGTLELDRIKRYLYPYWLMYLKIHKNDFDTYMNRDSISFDPSKYTYEKEFAKMNLEQFIEFCIRNRKAMLNSGKDIVEEII